MEAAPKGHVLANLALLGGAAIPETARNGIKDAELVERALGVDGGDARLARGERPVDCITHAGWRQALRALSNILPFNTGAG
jgi:hypothetical protein